MNDKIWVLGDRKNPDWCCLGRHILQRAGVRIFRCRQTYFLLLSEAFQESEER